MIDAKACEKQGPPLKGKGKREEEKQQEKVKKG